MKADRTHVLQLGDHLPLVGPSWLGVAVIADVDDLLAVQRLRRDEEAGDALAYHGQRLRVRRHNHVQRLSHGPGSSLLYQHHLTISCTAAGQ